MEGFFSTDFPSFESGYHSGFGFGLVFLVLVLVFGLEFPW